MSDDNVTPIAPVQECASCGSRHTHAERFRLDAHNEGCMQPEIRMKRLEARVLELALAVEELAQAVTGNPNTVLLKETHGISEAAPDTQRSGSPVRRCTSVIFGECGYCEGCTGIPRHEAADQRGAPADASPAEPERSPTAGAEPAGDAPGDP